MSQPLLSENFNAQPLPDFFPERLRRACAGKRITYRIPAGVRERMHVPENLDTAQWADKYRQVTAIDAHPGRWRNELVPHAVRAMRLTSAPWIKELYLCWPERAAKTQVITNAAMRQLDRGIESGNIFWLMPNEAEARKALGERIIPVLRATPRTARLLSKYADDTTRTMVRFRHGPRLFAAHAGSPASVSSFFGALNIADEIDKADTTGVGKETDIITLFRKRGRDRDDSKNLFVSTPAQGFIYKLTMGAQQVLEYRAKCPHCEHLVSPGEKHVIIPKGADADQVSNGEVPVSLACPDCGVEWSDQDRKDAYHHGDWVIIKGDDIARPETVGMHMTAYVIPAVPLKEIAAAILKASAGGETEKKALANGYDCKDYEARQIFRQSDHILALRDDRPEGLVPSVPIAAITCVADMQKRGFWYKITAWGYGLEQESWTLKAGYVDSWEALRLIMFESQFQDVRGNSYIVTLRGMDSGGGESDEHDDLSRTAEAYLFAAANPGVILFKGRRRLSRQYNVTDLDRIPGTNKPLPGSAKLYTLHTTFFKDKVAGKLLVSPSDPGAWHLHKDIDEDFAKQMCAEYKNDQGYYECPKGKANHYFDCAQMEMALVEIAQVKIWQQPEEIVAVPGARRVRGQGIQA